MADIQRMMRALQAADAAGDTAAATTLAQEIRRAQGGALQSSVSRESLATSNPGEYDPQSPQYQAKYGMGGAGAVARDVGRAALRSPLVAADAILNTGRQAIAAPVAGVAGLTTAPAGFIPGMQGVGARNVERVQRWVGGRPFTEGGEAVMEAVAAPFEKFTQGARWVGEKTQDVTGSPVLATAVDTAIQAAPALLARGRVGRGNRGPNTAGRGVEPRQTAPSTSAAVQTERAAGLGRVSGKAPSIDELQSAKNAAYTRAEQTGVVISRNAMNRLKVELVNDLKKEGLHKTLHPKANAAVQEILATKGQPTLTQLETLRKIANDARMAPDAADARLGARIIDRIDDFEAGLGANDVVSGNAAAATAFREARALNQRLAKARTIQKIFDDAEVTAGANYTVSGMENALRQQFKALAKNDKRLRGFSAQERAAIRKVAMGGPVENAMRLLGKFAPTGTVPTLVGLGAVSAAGPAGMALPIAGAMGRYGATRMTLRNANRVSELVRGQPLTDAAVLRNRLAESPVGQNRLVP